MQVPAVMAVLLYAVTQACARAHLVSQVAACLVCGDCMLCHAATLPKLQHRACRQL